MSNGKSENKTTTDCEFITNSGGLGIIKAIMATKKNVTWPSPTLVIC